MNKPPSPDTLALLAATLVRSIKTPAKQAVEYALELCHEAQEATTLTAQMKREVVRRGETDFTRSHHLPRQFPASFRLFLGLIVPGRSFNERRDRFLSYVQSRYGKRAAVAEVAWRQKEGFHTEREWRTEAGLFLLWWTIQKSGKASVAAKKRLTGKR